MPRMSEAEKQKSHERILKAAAEMFRDHGISATSLSDVMKAAGMTHGGFYRHFSGKDDLVAAAFRRAVDGVVQDMETPATASERKNARSAYIDAYLSEAHVQNSRQGCPMAALGSELVRGDGATRKTTSDAVVRVARLLAGDEGSAPGYAMLALMLGSVTLARLVESEKQAADIIREATAAMSAISDQKS